MVQFELRQLVKTYSNWMPDTDSLYILLIYNGELRLRIRSSGGAVYTKRFE